MSKVFSVYLEVIARGEDKDTVQGVVEEQLEQILGEGNVFVYETNELDEAEVGLIARMTDTNDNDPTEMDILREEKLSHDLDKQYWSMEHTGVEPVVQAELDAMDILREEKLSDELGA